MMNSKTKIQALIKACTRLVPLSIVDTNSDECKYHVPCKFANDSKVILVTPLTNVRAFVFVVGYSTSKWEDGSVSCHWQITVDLQDSRPFSHYTHKPDIFDDEPSIYMDSDERFYTCGWSSRHEHVRVFNYNAGGKVSPEEVAAYLNHMIDNQLANVDRGPITERTSLFHWTDHYAYPGSELTFWEKVDTKMLKKYVTNPY